MTILPPKGKSSAAHRKYFNENYHICFPSLFNLRCCGEPSLTSTKRFSASNFAQTWKRLVNGEDITQLPRNYTCILILLNIYASVFIMWNSQNNKILPRALCECQNTPLACSRFQFAWCPTSPNLGSSLSRWFPIVHVDCGTPNS